MLNKGVPRFRAPKEYKENDSFSLAMLYYGDKYRKMKVPKNYFILYFFYVPTSEILNPEKKIVEIEFYFLFFSSSDIRF